MIVEYHRPEEIEQALDLLARKDPVTLVMGGGTAVSQRAKRSAEPLALVDLQLLPIHEIKIEGQFLSPGAGVTLQQLYDDPNLPEALRSSLEIEAGLNLRQVATVAGTIVECSGRSAFVTALLALDPRLVWRRAGSAEDISLGDYLALKESEPGKMGGHLMISIRIPLNVVLHFQSVARSPLDQPIVCAAAAIWPSGRTRLTLGGYGKTPILAMDGPEASGIGMAARSAYLSAGDEWASAGYRSEVAAKLSERLV